MTSPPKTLPSGGTDAPESALLSAGLAASHANNSEQALHMFHEASMVSPANPVPHFLIGSEYASLGLSDKAEAALASAVVLAPRFHVARYQLGLLQLSGGRASVGLVTWEPLFQLEEADALVHFVRGFAAVVADDIHSARRHFESGLPRGQDNPALCEDVRRVMATLDQRAVQESNNAPAASGSGMANAAASIHVLVSNYGKFGGLH
ncbi:MAG: Tetratricopeptide domain protein [Ramlibacter sp.]|nr:Tetratricopeptide domain protein [Ramlibacter sp.]